MRGVGDRAKVLIGFLLVLLVASAARQAVLSRAEPVPDSVSCPDSSSDAVSVEQAYQLDGSTKLRFSLRPLADATADAPKEPRESEPSVTTPSSRSDEPTPEEREFARSTELEVAGEAVVERTPGGIGALPTISADYRRHLGFERYVRKAREAGGRFLLYDPFSGSVLSEVDPLTGRTFPARNLDGLSPRSRRIRSEPAVAGILGRSKAEFGVAGAEVILLHPFDLDAYLIGGMECALRDDGMDLDDFTEVRGVYLLENNQLVLRIDSGILKGGGSQELALRFSL